MATTVGQIITAARLRHAAFHKVRVPDVLVTAYLSDAQRMLMTKGSNVDATRMAVNCNIAFATQGGINTPGVVGAGTQGGLPGTLIGGVIQMPDGDAGPAIEINVDDSPILAADRATSVATSSTWTPVGAPGWTVNAFVGKIAFVTQGLGKGQRRRIVSNTAGQLTISTGVDGQQWQTIPDATTVIRVIDLRLVVDENVSFVTELPPTGSRSGYLIKLDVNGVPYIDVANPITVRIDNGIPLPPYERVVGGSVRLNSTGGLDPLVADLTIRTYRMRQFWGPSYTCWLEAEKLFLAGTLQDWANAVSIDLRIVPIPGDFVLLTDPMLLPDAAKPVMVASAAAFMAQRCASLPDSPAVDVDWFTGELEKAEDHFEDVIGATSRGQPTYVREIY